MIVQLLFLSSLGLVAAFRAFRMSPSYPTTLFSRESDRLSLDRELEVFFETAASSGSASIASLSAEERMERAQRGEFLENEIFDARDRLMALEERYMGGDKSVDVAEINSLRDEIRGLKDDYILLVGAKEMPLYFGRAPDDLQ